MPAHRHLHTHLFPAKIHKSANPTPHDKTRPRCCQIAFTEFNESSIQRRTCSCRLSWGFELFLRAELENLGLGTWICETGRFLKSPDPSPLRGRNCQIASQLHFSPVGRLFIPWPLSWAVLSFMKYGSRVRKFGRDGQMSRIQLHPASPTTHTDLEPQRPLLGNTEEPLTLLPFCPREIPSGVNPKSLRGPGCGNNIFVPFTPLFNSC